MELKTLKGLAWTLLVLFIIMMLALVIVKNHIDSEINKAYNREKQIVINSEERFSESEAKKTVETSDVIEEVTEIKEEREIIDKEEEIKEVEEIQQTETKEEVIVVEPEETNSDEETDKIIYDTTSDLFYTDWNGDGTKDLVRKEIDGNYYVFPNYGTDKYPLYSKSFVYG